MFIMVATEIGAFWNCIQKKQIYGVYRERTLPTVLCTRTLYFKTHLTVLTAIKVIHFISFWPCKYLYVGVQLHEES